MLGVGVLACVLSALAFAQASTPRQMTHVKDGQVYVWIPPGTFMMGCSPDDTACEPDERPRHRVALSKGFWIGETEVTGAAWQRTNSAPDAKPELPIGGIGWQQAADFCRTIADP